MVQPLKHNISKRKALLSYVNNILLKYPDNDNGNYSWSVKSVKRHRRIFKPVFTQLRKNY